MSLNYLKQKGSSVKPRTFHLPNMNPNDLDLVSTLSALVTDQDGETSIGELLNCFPVEDFAVGTENSQRLQGKGISKGISSFGKRLGTENAVYEEQRLLERSQIAERSWTEAEEWDQGNTTDKIRLCHRNENEKKNK